MFYKRDKGSDKNAKLSSQYESLHSRNGNWMTQSGRDSAFTAYNSTRHQSQQVASSGRSSNNVFSKVNDFKTSIGKNKKEIGKNLKDTKDTFSGSFKMLKSSLKDSVKTGKLYSKEREEEASSKGMKSLGMDMSEMSFEDFDFDGDDGDGDLFSSDDSDDEGFDDEEEEIRPRRNKLIKNQTNVINKGGMTAREAEMISTSVMSATNSIIKVNMAGFMKISDTYQYMNSTSSDAFSSILDSFGTLSNTLEDIINKKVVTTVHGSKTASSLSDLTKINFVTAKNISGVVSGVKDATEMMNMFLGPLLFGLAANPMYTGMKSAIKGKIKNTKFVKKAGRLNDRLTNTPLELYMALHDGEDLQGKLANSRIGRMINKKGILNSLSNERIKEILDSNFFNGNSILKSLKGLDTTAKLDKGTAVSFDAETHNTINTVIPGYLAKLYATLTGKKIYNDYDTGTWNTAEGSKKLLEKRRVKFLENNHDELSSLFRSKFKSKTGEMMKRVIDDNILTLDDLKSKEDNYTKEEYDNLRSIIQDDLESYRIAVRKGALISSAYYKNSTLSASEKNMYNDLFKDDDNIYKTGEEKELRKLKKRLIYNGRLMKSKVEELNNAKSTISELVEENAQIEEEKSKAESSIDEGKNIEENKDKEPKEDTKETKNTKDQIKDDKKVARENDKKAKSSSKELNEAIEEADDSSGSPFDILDDLKNGAKDIKNSKWAKKLADSKLGKMASKGYGKFKGLFSEGGRFAKAGRLFGRGKSKLSKAFGKLAGKADKLSTVYDVLNGEGDILDLADLGTDVYDKLKGKSFKDLGKGVVDSSGKVLDKGKDLASKGKDLANKGKDAVTSKGLSSKLGGYLDKGKSVAQSGFDRLKGGISTVTGSVKKGFGNILNKIGGKVMGKGLGQGLLKGGLRSAARTGLKALGPVGIGASLLLSGPEIMDTIKNPWESIKDPLGTIGSIFGFNDHPAKRNAEARARGEEPESITKKVFTAPLKWLGIMDDDKDKKAKNIAKASGDEDEDKKIDVDAANRFSSKLGGTAQATATTGGFLSLMNSGNTELKVNLDGDEKSEDGKDKKDDKDKEKSKEEKLNSVFSTLWKFTPMGMLGMKPPVVAGSEAKASGRKDDQEEYDGDGPSWLSGDSEETYGDVVNGESLGDMSSELGEQNVNMDSQAIMSNPGLIVNRLLMMSPLGMFMGLGKDKTDQIFKSNTMRLAEKDPKQFARVMFANTTIGSMYNLAEPSNLALSALSTGMLDIFAPIDDFTDNQDIMRDTTNFKGDKGTTMTIRDMNGDSKATTTSSSSSGGGDGKDKKEGTSTSKPSGEAKTNQTATGGSTAPNKTTSSSPTATSSAKSVYTGEKFERQPLPDFEKQAKTVIGDDVSKMDKIAKKIFEIRNRPDPRKDKILNAVKDLTKKMIDESKAHADPLTGYDYEAYLILKDILEVVENIGRDVVNINTSFDTVTTKLKTKTTKIVKNNSIRKVINKTIEGKISEQAATV